MLKQEKKEQAEAAEESKLFMQQMELKRQQNEKLTDLEQVNNRCLMKIMFK